MRNFQHQQKGLSLLELMVSLAIGIILLLGLASVYNVASKATAHGETIALTDEVARQVFRRLAYDFERAGYVDPLDAPKVAFKNANPTCETKAKELYIKTLVDFSQESTLNRFKRFVKSGEKHDYLTTIGRLSCGNMQPVKMLDNELVIAYQAAKADGHTDINLKYSNLPEKTKDCYGQIIEPSNDAKMKEASDSAKNGFVVNKYLIGDYGQKDKEPSLLCKVVSTSKSSSDKSKPLARGVHEMVVRFVTTPKETDAKSTLASTEAGRLVTAYKTPQQMNKDLLKDGELGWAAVIGVEVCLITAPPLVDGTNVRTLATQQGAKRPTCARKNNSDDFIDDVDKGDDYNSRFFTRHVRTFSLPNALYLPPKP